MAQIRIDPETFERRLTLFWQDGEFAAQEMILAQPALKKSGKMCEYLMNSVLSYEINKKKENIENTGQRTE